MSALLKVISSADVSLVDVLHIRRHQGDKVSRETWKHILNYEPLLLIQFTDAQVVPLPSTRCAEVNEMHNVEGHVLLVQSRYDFHVCGILSINYVTQYPISSDHTCSALTLHLHLNLQRLNNLPLHVQSQRDEAKGKLNPAGSKRPHQHFTSINIAENIRATGNLNFIASILRLSCSNFFFFSCLNIIMWWSLLEASWVNCRISSSGICLSLPLLLRESHFMFHAKEWSHAKSQSDIFIYVKASWNGTEPTNFFLQL